MGTIFVRVCPYFPFSTRICLNQHHWWPRKMKQGGFALPKLATPFAAVDNPRLSRSWLIPLRQRFSAVGTKWLKRLIPFFSGPERAQHGCWHQLFFSQVEYCDNLIFRRRAALDQTRDRLLDANRNSADRTS